VMLIKLDWRTNSTMLVHELSSFDPFDYHSCLISSTFDPLHTH